MCDCLKLSVVSPAKKREEMALGGGGRNCRGDKRVACKAFIFLTVRSPVVALAASRHRSLQ